MYSRLKEALSSNGKVIALTTLGVGAGMLTGYVMKSRRDSSQVQPTIRPDGGPLSTSTKLLTLGAKVLQAKAPLQGYDIYLVGFHPMTESPCHQMEAHHICKQVNQDFMQCILFDGNTSDANITGIEYIITERLFEDLPKEEKIFWHPHNYEIFSGMLTAPGLPASMEKELMKTKVNSYGKTLHTWRAKCWEGDQPYRDTLPKGAPLLGWSFNHDGEIKNILLETRDHLMNVDTTQKREERRGLVRHARPQSGVNLLLPLMKQEVMSIPGVKDIKDVEQEGVDMKTTMTKKK